MGMDILKVLIIFFFLFLLSSSPANSENLCPISYCPTNNLPIKYPLNLHGHQTPKSNYCSNTNLKCSNQGAVIFNLPNYGEFYVQDIHYEYEYPRILMYDPQNCLPKRFMASNNSSLTPEEAPNFLDYTFYSCPPNKVAWEKIPTVGCLSNSSSDVVAVRADLTEKNADLNICKEIFSLSMPVLRNDDPPKYIEDEREFHLEWNASRCGSCPPSTESYTASDVAVIVLVLFVLPFFGIISFVALFHWLQSPVEIFKMNRANAVSNRITPLP